MQAINSQSYKPAEVLVVHDGENRDIVEQIVKSMGLVYIRGRGQGVVDAYNLAIEMSSGEIIAFTDDDAIPDQRWLEEIAGLYTNGVGAVGGAVKSKDDAQPCLVTTKIGKTGEFSGWQIVRDMIEVDHLRGANMSFSRYAILKTGLFDRNFGGDGYLFESDYCLRVKRKGYRILFNPRAVVFHAESKERHIPRERSPSRRYHHKCNSTYFTLKHFAFAGNKKIILKMLLKDSARSVKLGILKLDVVYFCSFAGIIAGVANYLKLASVQNGLFYSKVS